MTRLNDHKRKSLTIEDLEEYPVWTRDDGRDNFVPILETVPPWDDYDTFFIKARFSTNGKQFNGYLMGGMTFYGFGLFIGDETFIVNFNIPESIEDCLGAICRISGCDSFSLFPLHYESSVRLEDVDDEIRGTFNPTNNPNKRYSG